MAAAVYTASEPRRPDSPVEHADEQPEQSWYRHSGHTGDTSSGRSVSPNSAKSKRHSSSLHEARLSLDPRRITPTLHANLVAEILNLRRDLDTKNAFIDNLETTLNSTKLNLESANEKLGKAARESSNDRRLADEAEKHLYKVTEELVRERDDALNAGQDLRKRLNNLTAKSRRQEQEFEKWQREYESKTSAWDTERQKLQHKLQTTETQLRVIVEDFERRESAQPSHPARVPVSPTKTSTSSTGRGTPSRAFESPEPFRKATHGRNTSILSGVSDLSNFTTPPRYPGRSHVAAKTLADEMSSDGEEEIEEEHAQSAEDSEPAEQQSPPRPGREPPGMVQTILESPASRALEPVDDTDNDSLANSGILGSAAVVKIVRVSPVQSPVLPQGQEESSTTGELLRGRGVLRDSLTGSSQDAFSNAAQFDAAVSTANVAKLQGPSTTYADASTQVESDDVRDAPSADRPRTPVSEPLSVPHIAIHPPTSAPVSPRNSVLPPRTANASSQTDSDLRSPMCDAEVQTEEIRINLRRFRAHLLPEPDTFPTYDHSAPLSDPHHQSYQSERSRDTIQSVSVQEIIPESLESRAIKETVQRSLARSPELNESSSGSRDLQHRSSFWGGQSARSSSMLMSLHDEPGIKSGQSSMLARELRKSGVSDISNPDTYLTPAIPEDYENEQPSNGGPAGQFSGPVPILPADGVAKIRELNSSTHGLRTAFRSRASSVATANSSNFSTASQPPPLPIPQRSSSRVHTELFEESLDALPESGSPRMRRQGSGSSGARPRGLRKARSSSSLKRSHYSPPKPRRRAGRLASLAPIQSMAFEDLDDIESANELHTPIEGPELDEPAGNHSAAQPDENDKPLVDAIAAAMVGEWMWKYPQKRKSFGIADSGKEFGAEEKRDATRQRRWIWLSPYERTIMWSSKQPLTGAALMGKASRKLLIKTVLDVRDDNPLPKGSNYATCYERSIIILTPDRPLKLTASSRDRHYFWLMALSFLANPNQGPPRIPRLPTTSKGAPENNRPPQLEHKDSVIEQSISKVGSGQARNFTAPALLTTAQGNIHERPQPDGSRTTLSGPSSSRSDKQDSFTENSSSRKLRWPGSSQPSGNKHARQRSNTAPVRQNTPSTTSLAMPPAIPRSPSRNGTMSSRSGSQQADRDRSASRREAGTIRMTAFVEPMFEDPYLATQDPTEGVSPALTDLPRFPDPPRRQGPGGSLTGPPMVPNTADTSLYGPRARYNRSAPPLSSSAASTNIPQALPSPALSARPFSPNLSKGLVGRRRNHDGREGAAVNIATDETRRQGYIFDDDGKDPFRGF